MSGRRTRSTARLAGLSAALALAVAATATAAGPGTGYRNKAAQLQVEAQKLDTRAHKALLDLYVLDSRLGKARTQLAALEAQSALLHDREVALTQQLTAAERSLAVSQQQLGDHLRSLYEDGTPDPFAVVLGAQSLDDAISKLDDLSRIAEQSRQVVEVTRAAQSRLERTRTTLARQRRKLDASLAAARGAARDLANAHAQRVSFVGNLRAQQQLKEAQIRGLLATARAVEQKSQKIQSAASEAPSDGNAQPPPTAAALPAPSEGGRTLIVSATGYALPGHTATGLPVGWGIVAVDPTVIPLGTRMTIPGYGEGVAADVGSAVKGATIDLWFPTLGQALAWGRRTVTITLH